jgi:hypothetical protein
MRKVKNLCCGVELVCGLLFVAGFTVGLFSPLFLLALGLRTVLPVSMRAYMKKAFLF